MSNWALELQQLNIERIWIRGEANILADAPSRAPLDLQGVSELPVPVGPVRQLIRQLYWSPAEEIFYTDKFVTILSEGEIHTGEGLRANQDFTSYQILKPSGTINLREDF